jgi:hypothetical protein
MAGLIAALPLIVWMPKIEVVTVWVVGIEAVARPVSSEAMHGVMVDTVVAKTEVAGAEASHSTYRRAAVTDMANANAVDINTVVKLSHVANVDTTDVGAATESFHVASAAKATAADRRPKGRVGPTRNGEA